MGPLRLIRRLLDARRGDTRAKQDIYHLRGVLNFVGLFAATVALPGMLLAYYGIAGLRAQRDAGAAQVAHDAELSADALGAQIEAEFKTFEDAALNRLTTGKSLHTRPGEMSAALRVVFRYDNGGTLAAPFLRGPPASLTAGAWRLSAAWRAATEAELRGDYAEAATRFAAFARRAQAADARSDATFARARCAMRAGDLRQAEAGFREVERDARGFRSPEGFRYGDLARFKLVEMLLASDPLVGGVELRKLVDALLAEEWVLGEGGEAAIARRSIDNILPTRENAEEIARLRETVDDLQTQLYWAGAFQDELDSLGTKGRLIPREPGAFSYFTTSGVLWAMTWPNTDQYVFALDSTVLLARFKSLGRTTIGTDSDVAVTVIGPDERGPPKDIRVRRPLARAPQWSIVAYPRDPAALQRRQAEDTRRGIGIVLVSVLMIGVGAFLSARLVRRELDAARLKSDFAANVSHELRSPITQIRLKAEALQLGLAETAEAQARHYDVIVREAERLSRMVDNMLDFAAIERGKKKYNLRLGDLAVTVQNVVETARVAMETRSMTIEENYPEDLPPVWHDAEAVAQVVVNLLSNAAKYGQEAAWIGVSVRTATGEVCVEVSDHGIGVDASELQAIFEQYYRSHDPAARRRKGTGIGLTIVKYIMEAHGGSVTVRSTLGVGTTFVLHFPIERPAGHDRQGA